MNDRIPCRVSADLRARDAGLDKLLDLAHFLDQAREDLLERLLEGERVGGYTFAQILDCEIDDRGRCALESIADILLGCTRYARDEHTHTERRYSARHWMRGLAERFLDAKPELIEERAETLRARDAEDEGEPE